MVIYSPSAAFHWFQLGRVTFEESGDQMFKFTAIDRHPDDKGQADKWLMYLDALDLQYVDHLPSTAHSTVQALPAIAVLGEQILVKVQLRSDKDEPLVTGGVNVTLTADRGVLGEVIDNEDGTYTATLTLPTDPGQVQIQAFVDGQPLGQSDVVTVLEPHTVPPEITLSHTPTAWTTGDVTISVTTDVYGSDSGNALIKLNWMAGSHHAVDFAGGAIGEDILGIGQFAVSTNGTYTVYAQDGIGNEAVKEIEISNIGTCRHLVAVYTPVLPEVDDSPVTEPTEDGVSLQVDASMITLETWEDNTVIEVVRLDDATLDKVVQELERFRKTGTDGASG